jgi:predicted AAA+ superfamily ATPase
MSADLHRSFETTLNNWFFSKFRKPLVLRGARQVGKTTIVRKWAKKQNLFLLEVNLDRHGPALAKAFATKDVQYILEEIQLRLRTRMPEGKPSAVFLDEIQSCPEALPALRYFHEDLRDLPVICAGSLLEFALSEHEYSMPVGRIEYRFLAPLTFREFLGALKEDDLLESCHRATHSKNFKISQAAHERLLDRLGDYFYLGGMPECVANHVEGASLDQARKAQFEILGTYRDDFPKYAKKVPVERLHEILDAAPRMVTRKFKFTEINREIRSREIKTALNLLTLAGIFNVIHHSNASALPLVASENTDVFKLLFVDVGLLNSYYFGASERARRGRRFVGLWQDGNDMEKNWLGQICEQFIGQSLVAQGSRETRSFPHYWLRENRTGSAELDFLKAYQGNIFPIEVKAGGSGALKSLHTFMAERNFATAVRFDALPPSLQNIEVRTPIKGGDIATAKYQCLSLPLYLADWLEDALSFIGANTGC